jgi:hypothetical protein
LLFVLYRILFAFVKGKNASLIASRDCEAKREVVPGKWEDVLVEFEFESRNFKEHRHDPAGCDVMVCWRHNWPDCPEWLEVIELCNEVM